jgi:hypothetical protein
MKRVAKIVAAATLLAGLSVGSANANHTVPAVCAARRLSYTRASADCWGGPHWVRVIARQSNGVTRYGYWALNDHSQVFSIWPHTFVDVRFEAIRL